MPAAGAKYRAPTSAATTPDFARAFGGYGERVSDPAEIIPAIRRAIARTEDGQPALLEFLTAKEISFSMF